MLKKTGILISLLLCLFVGKYSVQYFFEEIRQNREAKVIEKQFEQIEQEAEKIGSDGTKSEAIRDIAIKKAEENLNTQKNPTEKKRAAISTFLGFYLVNYRTRCDYCDSLGVDISKFASAFKAAHEKELMIADKFLLKGSNDMDRFYRPAKDQFEKIIIQDMKDFSDMHNITPAKACELINENGKDFAKQMLFSNIQPNVSKAIHEEI